MDVRDLIFVTSGYKVVALRKSSGRQEWETVLVERFFKPSVPFVTLLVDETGVYAHTINEIFRLNLETGAIVWRKELQTNRWTTSAGIASLATLGASSSSAGPASQKADERRRSD